MKIDKGYWKRFILKPFRFNLEFNKKYKLEIVINKNGLWYVFNKPKFNISKKFNTPDATHEELLQFINECSPSKETLKPVYFSYDVGVPADQSSNILSSMKMVTFLIFQFRLHINGYIYKETPLSKRFKCLVNYSVNESDKLKWICFPQSKQDKLFFAEEIRKNIWNSQ